MNRSAVSSQVKVGVAVVMLELCIGKVRLQTLGLYSNMILGFRLLIHDKE